MDAIRFAIADQNEKKVKGIIYRANEFCRTRLTRRGMAIDTFWIISNYTQLLGNNTTRWNQWDELLEGFQRNITLVALPTVEEEV